MQTTRCVLLDPISQPYAMHIHATILLYDVAHVVSPYPGSHYPVRDGKMVTIVTMVQAGSPSHQIPRRTGSP